MKTTAREVVDALKEGLDLLSRCEPGDKLRAEDFGSLFDLWIKVCGTSTANNNALIVTCDDGTQYEILVVKLHNVSHGTIAE